MKKILPWVLIVTAVAPIVFVTHSLSPAIIGKNILFQIVAVVALVLAAGAVYADSAVLERFRTIARNPIFVTLGLLTLWYGITTITAYDPTLSLYGESNRGEGFGMFVVLAILAYLMAVFFEKRHWFWFFAIGNATVFPMFVRSLIEINHGIERPYAYIGNPIFLAAWYLLASFGALVVAKKQQVFGWVIFVLCMVGIFLTMSRGVILGTGVGVVAAAVLAVQSASKDTMLRKVGRWALGVVTCFVIVFVLTRNHTLWQSVPGLNRIASGNTTTLTSRLIYLDMTIQGFKQESFVQKVTGWGWDNGEAFLNKYYNPSVYRYDAGNPDRVHNKLADMLAMTGIVGLGLYLALWYFFIKDVWRGVYKKDLILGIGFVSIGIAYFVQNLFSFDVPILTFSFYVLLAYSVWFSYEKTA